MRTAMSFLLGIGASWGYRLGFADRDRDPLVVARCLGRRRQRERLDGRHVWLDVALPAALLLLGEEGLGQGDDVVDAHVDRGPACRQRPRGRLLVQRLV